MNSKKVLLVPPLVVLMALLMSFLLILAFKTNVQSERHSDEKSTNKNDTLLSEVIEQISTRKCIFDKIEGTIGWQCSLNGECYKLSWICDKFNQCLDDDYDEKQGCNLFEGKFSVILFDYNMLQNKLGRYPKPKFWLS